MLTTSQQEGYVVWDGSELRPYVEPSAVDLIFLMDGAVSVQTVRTYLLRKNIDVIQWFSCKSGCPSYYRKSREYVGGVFTECVDAVIREQPTVLLKKAVCEVNRRMQVGGADQVSEVVCLPEFLDLPVTGKRGHSKPVFFLKVEACRTLSSPDRELVFPRDAVAGGVRPLFSFDHYRNGKIINSNRFGYANA